MTFVFPMAGKGQRFIDAGYDLPKYLVKVNDKTLLQYSIESLPLEIADQIVFIALKEHEEKFLLSNRLKSILGNHNFTLFLLDELTRGQAETVLKARHYINSESDLVIYNIDTCFKSHTLKELLLSDNKYDGVIGCFHDTNPHWSFASLDSDNRFVIATAEKEPISTNALTGLYHFTKASDFFEVASHHVYNNLTFKNEFYIAPMYNDLIKKQKHFVLDQVDYLIPLGTPEEVKRFQKINT